ncbi:MAG: cysteine desulfurase family protein, partial [Geminicoccaceae bacterium]|nr:cysteine desulfurase family protein [Geminicoccaceae bacterium]
RKLVEEARAVVAAVVGGAPAGVVFTSGGTEANNLALRVPGDGPVLVSAIEHDSVLAAAPEAIRLPARTDGRVDLEAARQLIERHRPRLVSVMLVNNETGVIQPVVDVARAARDAGALVHSDAVQAVGRLEVDMARLGVDLLTLSAHKLGGPPGVGALIVRDGLEIEPLIRGGGQEQRRRAGTENVPGIVGFGRVAELIRADWVEEVRRLEGLRDRLETELFERAPDARIFGREAPRVGNTSCIAMSGVASETQVIALDLEGVAVSAGAACSSGKVGRSHVLDAMGGGEFADTAIRVSLGHATRSADVERFVEAWLRLYERSRRRAELRRSA